MIWFVICCLHLVGGEFIWDDSILLEYQRLHHKDSIHGLENRRFMIASLHCDEGMGNRMGSFWNTIGIAVVTNRTVLVDISQCSTQYLQIQEWVPELTETMSRFPEIKAIYDDHAIIHGYKLGGYCNNRYWCCLVYVTCCQVDAVPNRLLTIPHVYGIHASTLNFPGADLAFVDSRDRAKSLFGQGHLHGFGQILSAFTSFNPLFSDFNRLQLEQMQGSVFNLAVHLRHRLVEDDGTVGDGIATCVNSTVAQLRAERPGQQCNLILATDRTKTIDDMLIVASQLNCTLVSSSKQGFYSRKNSEHAFARGLDLLGDIHLLSKADALVGSSIERVVSTISLLIAILLTPKNGPHFKAVFAPTCGLMMNYDTGASPETSPFRKIMEDQHISCSDFATSVAHVCPWVKQHPDEAIDNN